MQVILSINESTFAAVQEKIRKAESFLPPDSWVQIDMSDGIFDPVSNWSDATELATLQTWLNIELHLMVIDPENVVAQYAEALQRATSGKRRIIIQYEVMQEPGYILRTCRALGVDVGLALKPTTKPELIMLYLREFHFIQILAVDPGPSGQQFQPSVLPKIQFLKSQDAHVIIEVDGGMNLETARLVKQAGADIIVSGAYVFEHPSPKVAYEELQRV